MPLKVKDANNQTQLLPVFVDPVYRAAGAITDVQGGGTASDVLLFTASATGVTRLLKAKFRLTGGGTATGTGGSLFEMLRVVVAPTGQVNAGVTATKHDPSDAAPGSAVAVTPSTDQTPGTLPTVLGSSNLSLSAISTTNDLFQSVDAEFPTGSESSQKEIVIPAGAFVTFRPATALPSASVLQFDLMWSEATS